MATQTVEKHWPVAHQGQIWQIHDYAAHEQKYDKYLVAYRAHAVVRTCAERNAQQVAATGFNLYSKPKANGPASKKLKSRKLSYKKRQALRRKDYQADSEVVEVTDHPIIDLLNSPHLNYVIDLNKEVFGVAYLHYEINPVNGLPENWKVLKTQYVHPILDKEGNVDHYDYVNYTGEKGQKRETVQLPVKDNFEGVIAFRKPKVEQPYHGGDTWIAAVIDKITLSNKFTQFMTDLIDNRGRPDSILIPTDENTDPDAWKRIEVDFMNRFSKRRNGLPGVVPPGYKYQPISFPPTDLAPLEINNATTKEIANAAGMPYALLTNDSNYSNMQASLELWARQAIEPRVKDKEEVINDFIVPLYGDDSLFIEYENPVPEDDEQQLKVEAQKISKAQVGLTGGIMTTNEIRALLDLEPIEGGDELFEAAVPANPFAPQNPEPEPAPEEDDDDDDEPTPVGDGGKSLDIDAVMKVNAAVAKGEMDRATAINIVARALEIEDAEAKHLVTHPVTKVRKPKPPKEPGKPLTDRKLAQVVREQFEKQKDHYLGKLGLIKGAKGYLDVKAKDDELPDEFTPLEEWDEELSLKCKPLIELEMKNAADGRAEVYGRVGASDEMFEVIPARVNEAVDKASLKFAQSTNETTAKNLNDALAQLRNEIDEGLVEGDSITAMRKRVQEVFENASNERAELIARSEVSRAVHEGVRIAAKASGVVKGFKLLVSGDACPLCQSYAEKEIGLDEKFNTEDDYDDSILPIHPNCTCSVTEVLA